MEQIRKTIVEHLDHLEKEHGVKILLACESGSRAWGFPSRDSDYDVRFIYVHPKDWYLSIADKRDVIELPIHDDLDINGWDLRKSLQLLRKSNLPLLEWLSSPIKYRYREIAVDPIVSLSKKAFMPESACHHYLSMAKNSIDGIQNNERVRIKTYMYALRPLLCCNWIVKNLSQPPMQIGDLLSTVLDNTQLKKLIEDIIAVKNKHSEKFSIQRSSMVEQYLHHQLDDLENKIPKNPPKPDIKEFDVLFREIVHTLDG